MNFVKVNDNIFYNLDLVTAIKHSGQGECSVWFVGDDKPAKITASEGVKLIKYITENQNDI